MSLKNGQVGILVKEQRYYLTNKGYPSPEEEDLGSNMMIITPNSELIPIKPDDIHLSIDNFIPRNVFNSTATKTADINEDTATTTASLVYTLNVAMDQVEILHKLIKSRYILDQIYMVLAPLKCQQRIITMDQIIQTGLQANDWLRRKYESSWVFKYSLPLALHRAITEDPIKFRVMSESFKLDSLIPEIGLDNTHAKYIVNHVKLVNTLENVIQMSSKDLNQFSHIWNYQGDGDNFNIVKHMNLNKSFGNLVKFMKYSVFYPNEQLFKFLTPILPNANQKNVYDSLKARDLYSDNNATNNGLDFILQSGVHDHSQFIEEFHEQKMEDNITGMQNQMQYILNNPNTASNKSKIDPKRQCYQFSPNLFFSLEKINLTSHKVNLLIPAPHSNPFDKETKLTSKKNGKIFIKCSFVHNLLTKPTIGEIEVSLDHLINYTSVDKQWFTQHPQAQSPEQQEQQQHENLSRGSFNERKMKCWVSLNRLENILYDWQKGRLSQGHIPIPNDNLDKFTQMEKSLKVLLNELLTKYCFQKGVKVNYKICDKIDVGSDDKIRFTKFKLFKWFANSYETFQYVISSGHMRMNGSTLGGPSGDNMSLDNTWKAIMASLMYVVPMQNYFGKISLNDSKKKFNNEIMGMKNGYAQFVQPYIEPIYHSHFGDTVIGKFESKSNLKNLYQYLIEREIKKISKPWKRLISIYYINKHLDSNRVDNISDLMRCVHYILERGAVIVNEQTIAEMRDFVSDYQMNEHANLEYKLNHIIKSIETSLRKQTSLPNQYVGSTAMQSIIGRSEGDELYGRLLHRASVCCELAQDGLNETLECIVVDPVPTGDNEYRCYSKLWGMDVLVQAKGPVTVGDILLCNEIVTCNPLKSEVALKAAE